MNFKGCLDFVKKEYKAFLILFFLFLINIFLFKYKMCDVYIDFGKEIYLPKAIAEGGVLYKDVLAVFGPFAYLLNALFVKLFGVSVRTFYIIGGVNALLIITGIYLLCREFISHWFSFFIAAFVLYFCCFVPDVMNYVTPYSYGMVYGLCAVIYSASFFVKYLKSGENKLLYISMFLAGIAAANKYEFVFPALVLIIFILFKRVNFFVFIKSILSFVFIPLLCLIVLFWQGLAVADFFNYLNIWFGFAGSADMKQYYTGTFYFSFNHFVIALKSLAFSSILMAVIYYIIKLVEKVRFRYFAFIMYAVFGLLGLFCGCRFSEILINYVFYSLAMVLAVISLIKIKDLFKNLPVLFLAIFSISVGLKSFFFVQINQYGRYFLPLLLIAFIVILKEYYFKNNCKVFKITTLYFLIVMIAAAFWGNIQTLKFLNYKISSPYGTIYKDEVSAKIFNTMLDTVNKLAARDDTIVVLQEGLMINFLSGRKSDKYNYLIPSLLNLYGEDNVVEEYKNTQPEMFIIFTSPGDKALICNGWGYKICAYVGKNYKLVQTIKADKLILIFKKI